MQRKGKLKAIQTLHVRPISHYLEVERAAGFKRRGLQKKNMILNARNSVNEILNPYAYSRVTEWAAGT